MIESGTGQFWRATLALCLGSFMIFANVYITQPLLPMLQQSFHLSTLEAGWSFTITTLTLGISLLALQLLDSRSDGQQPQQRPQQQQRQQQAPHPRDNCMGTGVQDRQAQPAPGIDDFDDDIPF